MAIASDDNACEWVDGRFILTGSFPKNALSSEGPTLRKPDTSDPSCVFCKIVRGEIPSSRVLETAEAIAFLDIHPVNLGHVLLVPKEHHADLSELSEPLAAHVGGLLPGLCRAVRAATGADGVNVIVNIGRAAGQTVDHGHWHVIPRFIDDPVNWPWPHSEYAGDELGQMRFRIERELDPTVVED